MGTQPSENCPLDLSLLFSVETKTVSVSTNLSTGSASFDKTQMIKKDNFQTSITDATSSSPHSYYRTDLLIQYKSAKMKNRIPDWKYTKGRIRLQKVAEFHEEEVWIFYVWVSVHRKSILYKEPTRCNFGSIAY